MSAVLETLVVTACVFGPSAVLMLAAIRGRV